MISATQFLTEISAGPSDAPTLFRPTGVCLHPEFIPARSHHAINTPLPSPTRGTSCCVNRSYYFACLCLSLPGAPAPPGDWSGHCDDRGGRRFLSRSTVGRGPLSFSIRGDFQHADHQIQHEILSVTGCCEWHTNLYEVYRMSAIWQFNCDIKVPLLRFEPLRGRLDRALLPGLEIRQQRPLQVISKRQTDA